MTDREQIKQVLAALWKARVADDLEGTLHDIAPDGMFTFNGRGLAVEAFGASTKGLAAIRPLIKDFIDNWKLADWRQVDLLIDGEKAVMHWSAKVTFQGTGKSDMLDVFDFVTFRDGKIVHFHQCTDTALMMRLATP
jgi:ketosteroid isomerase-like protein